MTSRTSNSIHNAKIALVFYSLNVILQFFSRKIFLDYLGSEILGLNTTAQNLLGFLNIAELGIGAAVAYSLYKPLYNKDIRTINDIVSVQGWLYRKVATIVIISATILICFFPLIFEKAKVPLWYTYATFIALLISSLLGYFVNYKQIILSADQKEYAITLRTQGIKIIKVLLQMLAIVLLTNGYVYWIILEVIMAIILSIFITQKVKKDYPWLQTNISDGSKLRKKYPDIIKKTQQLFFHKIGGFVLSQTSPIIIYAYTTLTLVAIYGNYMLIITGLTALMNAILNGISASIGNLVAEGNKKRIKKIFWEITILRMWIASIMCFGMYELSAHFINIWVGSEYILPKTPLIIMIVTAFIGLTRSFDAFISAYGLFQDIWAPITEATLNLGCSIILGYFFGLSGILSGILISQLLIISIWKPIFLYYKGFRENATEYFSKLVKYIIIFFIGSIFTKKIVTSFHTFNIDTYFQFIGYSFIVIIIYAVSTGVILYISDKPTKGITLRLINILNGKRKEP